MFINFLDNFAKDVITLTHRPKTLTGSVVMIYALTQQVEMEKTRYGVGGYDGLHFRSNNNSFRLTIDITIIFLFIIFILLQIRLFRFLVFFGFLPFCRISNVMH